MNNLKLSPNSINTHQKEFLASVKKQRTNHYSVKNEPRDEAKPATASLKARKLIAVRREDDVKPNHVMVKKETLHGTSNKSHVTREEENLMVNKELTFAPSNKLHVAFFGPVLGQFCNFSNYLKICKQKRIDTGSNLDACFCVGPFFHDDASLGEKARKLISGGYALPCPVYFTDKGSLPSLVTEEALQSFDREPNLHYLSASDGVGDIVTLLDDRLSVAFTSPQFSFTPDSVLESKCKASTYKGCDVLLTSEWGFGIHSILDTSNYFPANDRPDVFFGKLYAQERFDVARVALMVQPRYHITPSTASLGYCHFRTSSFMTSSTSSMSNCCNGFYSLSSRGASTEKKNRGKDKYCIVITPVKEPKANPDFNPYRAYALYLEKSSMPVSYHYSHDSDNSHHSNTAYDHQAISPAGEEQPKVHSKRGPCDDFTYSPLENTQTSNKKIRSTLSDQLHQRPVATVKKENEAFRDVSKPLGKAGTSPSFSGSIEHHSSAERIPVKLENETSAVATTPSEHSGASYCFPGLINERPDMDQYEKPSLHEMIMSGKYQEALRAIEGKKKLKRKVDDRSQKLNSISAQILEVESFDDLGNLPLHSLLATENCISEEKPQELLKSLLKAYPEAACTRQSCGDLPLSLVCRPSLTSNNHSYSLSINKVDDKVIKGLTKFYPPATNVKYDETDKSLLHILLEHRPSIALVKFIVMQSKTAIHCEKDQEAFIHGSILEYCDEEKQLPLHTAIQYYAPCDVIEYLIKKFPRGVCMPMKDKDLPLHCAARWGCSEKIMVTLLNHFPAAVVTENDDMETPLELIFSNEGIWAPNFEIPEVSCNDDMRSRIISRENEAQIPPRGLMSPFQMVERMVNAYEKFEGLKKPKGKKSLSTIQNILKDETKVWPCIQNLRKKLQSKKIIRELDEAEAYLRKVRDEGVTPPQLHM
jgi:hypothetical protein